MLLTGIPLALALLLSSIASGAPTAFAAVDPIFAPLQAIKPRSPDNPRPTPVHVPPPAPILLPRDAVYAPAEPRAPRKTFRFARGGIALDGMKGVDLGFAGGDLFARNSQDFGIGDTLFKRGAGNEGKEERLMKGRTLTKKSTACLDSTANDTTINSLFHYGGAGTVVSLCPSVVVRLTSAIFFTAPNQELSTEGYPTDSTRATLVVTGANQSCAVYGQAGSNYAAVRNIQIDGARDTLGLLANGLALLELGGDTVGHLVDNCHLYEPRGWSVLHGIEGSNLDCSNMTVSNNQVGPSGHGPGEGKQFRKRHLNADGTSHTIVERDGVFPAGEWADGISMACKQSTIINNAVTDPTDGGIVIFQAPGSLITNNTVRSVSRQLLGGINMVDYAPFAGPYTGTVVTGNTVIAESDFIKVGIAVGGMVWGSDNRTSVRTSLGQVYGNTLISGATGYFGYGIAVAGHDNAYVMNNNAAAAQFGGEPSDVCFNPPLMASPQAFVYDPQTTPGATLQAEFAASSLVFLVCQEPGAIVQQGPNEDTMGIAYSDSNATASSAANLALAATVSSSSNSADQGPEKAIDGDVNGYSTNYLAEWASANGKAGTWLQLTWATSQTVNEVILYDRPNANDQILRGVLTFEDGSSVLVPTLNNDGTALSVTFPTKNTKTIVFKVVAVSPTTTGVGLAEIQVFGTSTDGASTTVVYVAAPSTTVLMNALTIAPVAARATAAAEKRFFAHIPGYDNATETKRDGMPTPTSVYPFNTPLATLIHPFAPIRV